MSRRRPWVPMSLRTRGRATTVAGVTYDDGQPTTADNDELRRALGVRRRDGTFTGQNGVFQQAYWRGLDSRPADPGWSWLGPEHLAWIAGRWERNRRRQERALELVAAAWRRFRTSRASRVHRQRDRLGPAHQRRVASHV